MTGPVRIPLWGVHVTTPEIGARRSTVRVEVSVEGAPADVRVTVLDPHGDPVTTRRTAAGATGRAVLDLPVRSAALWFPDSPHLCTARAEVLVGGRVVDTVKITGGCDQHDHGPLGVVALDRSEERRVKLLKAAGFNALRTAHNPTTPALLDACDRLAVAFRDGREIGRTALRAAGARAALRLVPDVRSLTAGRDDLAHVLVEVVDAHGRLVPDATVQAGSEVGGAGELAGVANGNPYNVDSFRRPRHHTWHGRAPAVLRPGEQAGHVGLTVMAPGLRPATLTLAVESGKSE
ncbi:glycoside hydrolase family 2 TIM barrel-domain containing protein [Streptomyces sp. NPDC004237]|uniref:glycoside hydrolase family 2 TIM barrel-domain containing protein n=1 Tax=Streptomyces sp. NPDC004237 TaxID=3154455 RepID=UPI00339F54DE